MWIVFDERLLELPTGAEFYIRQGDRYNRESDTLTKGYYVCFTTYDDEKSLEFYEDEIASKRRMLELQNILIRHPRDARCLDWKVYQS